MPENPNRGFSFEDFLKEEGILEAADAVAVKRVLAFFESKNKVRVQSVKSGEGYTAIVRFTDGSCRAINLAPYLRGPIFEPIRDDPALFRAMQVEEGTIVWPNGADIDPDVLYYGLSPAWKLPDKDDGELEDPSIDRFPGSQSY